ncbi:MAG: alpha/beta fold hydrolase [Bacteroidota bacterium]
MLEIFNFARLKLCFTFACLFVLNSVFSQDYVLEKAEPFIKNLTNPNIEWFFCEVPENWTNNDGNKIKIATAVLKNTSGNTDAEAFLYIPGGPGGGGLEMIRFWLNHPLNETYDIVLADLRGTGFSEPRLCKDLGNQLFNILAKNQSAREDELQKVKAAMACKLDLEASGIDWSTYNSYSMAQDLHHMKKSLGYEKWHVYGVSYGTFVAQVYSSQFSEDVSSLIIDSSISDISTYYTHNTSGYMNSLQKVFERCEQDPGCKSAYPDLEATYHKTIEQLRENPISVKVDVPNLDSTVFTYNEQDFKVALQQALYNKWLVEVMPLLIQQFHDRDKETLGALVAAFAGAFNMDYGTYFSVSCNEVLPFNDPDGYEKDASQYKNMEGGLSFYKSDFAVCDKWIEDKEKLKMFDLDSSVLIQANIPILIFSGAFDPITPAVNGKTLDQSIPNTQLVHARHLGHVPSFYPMGRSIIHSFVDDPTARVDGEELSNFSEIKFIKDIKINSGVSKFGASLSNPDIFFLVPLIIALLIAIISSLVYLYKFIRARYSRLGDKLIRGIYIVNSLLLVACIVFLILAISATADRNFYILAFGLDFKYDYIFLGLKISCLLVLLTLPLIIIYYNRVKNIPVLSLVLFSNILILVYAVYWGLIF